MDTVFDLIEPFDKCIKSLREARRKQIDEFQRECCHPTEHLVEGEYLPLNYCSIPPVRVCKRCGVAEEGWQVHKILPSSEPVAKVSREEARKYILTMPGQSNVEETANS